MDTNFVWSVATSTANTLTYYLPSWVIGVLGGVVLTYLTWLLPSKRARQLYFVLSGISFIPVTILLPYFIRYFGLKAFVFPLLALPVLLITFATAFEAIEHVNKNRITLLVNYEMSRTAYFWKVALREVAPSLRSVARQTLSLCFAIFLALDYFIEYWGGLGALVQRYYYGIGTEFSGGSNQARLAATILFAGLLGVIQIVLNEKAFRRLTEFRRHY